MVQYNEDIKLLYYFLTIEIDFAIFINDLEIELNTALPNIKMKK